MSQATNPSAKPSEGTKLGRVRALAPRLTLLTTPPGDAALSNVAPIEAGEMPRTQRAEGSLSPRLKDYLFRPVATQRFRPTSQIHQAPARLQLITWQAHTPDRRCLRFSPKKADRKVHSLGRSSTPTDCAAQPGLLLLEVVGVVAVGVANRVDLPGILARDAHPELVFEAQHQLNQLE